MTRQVEIKPGTEIRIRGLRWDEGWEFDCPTVIISPVLKVWEDGRSLDAVVEDLCIDACIEGKLSDRESSAWRWEDAAGGALAYLRRKFYRKWVERCDVRVRFFLDEDGELTWEEMATPAHRAGGAA